MANDNGLITAPVSMNDIHELVGESSYDLGTLCKSTNINMWSKVKPIRYSGELFDLTDEQRKSVNYGIGNIPEYTQVATMASDVLNGRFTNANNVSSLDTKVDAWQYYTPQGGSSSPYRMGDFKGYWKYASSPFGKVTSSTIESALSGNVSIVFGGNTTDSDSVRLTDMYANSRNVSGMYMGLCLYDGSKYFYMTQKTGYDEGTDLKTSDLQTYGIFFRTSKLFTLMGKTSITCKAFLFLSTTPIAACTSYTASGQAFIPAEPTLCEVTIKKGDISLTVDCQAYKDGTTLLNKNLYGSVSFKNTTSSNVYVTEVKAEVLTSSGDTILTTTIYSTTTTVAANASFSTGNKTIAVAKQILNATDVRFYTKVTVGSTVKTFITSSTIYDGLPK